MLVTGTMSLSVCAPMTIAETSLMCTLRARAILLRKREESNTPDIPMTLSRGKLVTF